jgi:D-alanine-D-alanine ligase
MNKKRVAILCGGRSAEHEVSLMSAVNVLGAINHTLFEPMVVVINKSGVWHLVSTEQLKIIQKNPATIAELGTMTIVTVPLDGRKVLQVNGVEHAVDVVFPILHGPYGEDGTVQGLCKLMNVPCVGAGVLGSAVGMDKDMMKRLLREAGLPIGRYQVCTKSSMPDFATVAEEFGLPLFIKPANMGSSVGVSKVMNEEEWNEALALAFTHDSKVLIEECIVGRELECAVLGNEEPKASCVGEVAPAHDFYSYDAKYIDPNGATLAIPADIAPAVSQEVRTLAVRVFQVLECRGLGRVDVFLTPEGKLIINEINTIPGFTSSSMYPKLWEASGISYPELIGRLIELAGE